MEDNTQNKIIWALLAIVLILLFLIVSNSMQSKRFQEQNIIIPKNLQGIIYGLNEDIAIIKLDLTDKNQAELMNSINAVCQRLDIDNCKGL